MRAISLSCGIGLQNESLTPFVHCVFRTAARGCLCRFHQSGPIDGLKTSSLLRIGAVSGWAGDDFQGSEPVGASGSVWVFRRHLSIFRPSFSTLCTVVGKYGCYASHTGTSRLREFYFLSHNGSRYGLGYAGAVRVLGVGGFQDRLMVLSTAT